MKKGRSIAAAAMIVAALSSPATRAEAQQLGWTATLGANCLNTACDHVAFVVNLLGLNQYDSFGVDLTGAGFWPGTPGYVSNLTLQSTNAGSVAFSSGSVTSNNAGSGTWSLGDPQGSPDGQLLVQFHGTDWDFSPITIDAWLTGNGTSTAFTGSGEAHLSNGSPQQSYTYAGATTTDAPLQFPNANCHSASSFTLPYPPYTVFPIPQATSACVYQNGSYNTGTAITPTTSTPEPASIALMGTGLLGLAGVASQRRRRNAK